MPSLLRAGSQNALRDVRHSRNEALPAQPQARSCLYAFEKSAPAPRGL